MSTAEAPRPQDDLDRALAEVLEYLALSGMVEGELNAVVRPMNRIVVALLASQESQGGLSAYRRHLLQRIRAAGEPEPPG
jgi:hypothetical protein